MLVAAVVQLRASEEGTLRAATGRDVHGFWFRQWTAVNSAVADRLHQAQRVVPFALSPLMGLPPPEQGRQMVPAGTPAWFRVATLEAELSASLEVEWLPRLPEEVLLGSIRWEVLGWTADGKEHPWAGRVEARALAEERLLARTPPQSWSLTFRTPTAFHGQAGHLPFPLPNVLISSWLRRWQALGPVLLPDDLPERAQRGLVVNAFALKTVPVRDERRVLIGCVGRMAMRAVSLSAGERAAVDLLTAYAFWAGSGHHTTQGMGLTWAMPQAAVSPHSLPTRNEASDDTLY